jgi:hypothetical protein
MSALLDHLWCCKTYDSETHHEGPETRRWVRFHRLLIASQHLSNHVLPHSITSTHPQAHLMLSVLRHERIRHELWVNQDLIVERIRLASEFFIV